MVDRGIRLGERPVARCLTRVILLLFVQVEVALVQRDRAQRGNERITEKLTRNRPPREQPLHSRPPWFGHTTPPKDPHQVRVHEGKEWYWCGTATGGTCEHWRRHKGSECWQGNYPPGQGRRYNRSNDPPKKKKKVTFGADVAHNVEFDDSDSDQDEKTGE